MSKHAKIITIIGILGLTFVGFLLFRDRSGSSSGNITVNSGSPPSLTTDDDSNASPFIRELRHRTFEPSQITIENTIAANSVYTGYLFSYQSDGLKIYGRMNVPAGQGPFPVIILNHGYFNQSSFTSGDGTQTMADILARNGYLTLASDYRGFGKSENDSQGSRGHNPNYAIDVLNLIASVKNVKEVDPDRIGMWGHSMGGEVAIRTVEATDKVKAVVLWAPTSTDASENAAFYGRGRQTSPSPSQESQNTYSNEDIDYITAPISLHQGLSDTEVDPAWSKELNDELKKEGKSIEYFEYPGQDHNFRNLGWEVISKRTIEFFGRYLKS